MKIIRASEKKKIIKQLEKQYGIQKLPYLLLQFGKSKVRAFSGSLSSEELNVLDNNLRIENIGLYLYKIHPDGFRFSLDALHFLQNQINKNILPLTDKQALMWFKGQDLQIEIDRNFKVLKHKHDFIGCGKSTGSKITNFLPKERRIKN